VEKTLLKGLTVVEALAAGAGPRGVSELARDLGLLKSNVHRILNTLSKAGYVRRVDAAGRYELTLKLWQLGAHLVGQLDLRKLALPYLRELCSATGETTRLSVLNGDHALCIEQIETEHPLRVQTPVGGKLLLYCSATGKALLAYQSPAFIDQIAATLRPLTPRTLTTRAALLLELKRLRKDGFAVNAGEARAEVRGVAAAIRDSAGVVSASIGVSGPADRFSVPTLRRYGLLLRDAAERLSRDLGYQSEPIRRTG
jgi:IclR family transcriptional regulator, KDG regulon repressor